MQSRLDKMVSHLCINDSADERSTRRPSLATRVGAAALVAFFLSGPVSGQFVVQPAKVELTPAAGDVLKPVFKLENYTNEKRVVELQVLELTQWENDGVWRIIEPNSGFDTTKLSSCTKWISKIPAVINVTPVTSTPLPITIRVPRSARGFYGAAIVATLRSPPDIVGVGVTYRFVVPILIEIQGRPMPHRIELADVGMRLYEPNERGRITTFVSMTIANKGGTFCRLNAATRVTYYQGGHWRQLKVVEFGERNIIPGVTLKIENDIQRSLPSGKYRIEGALSVDGRTVKALNKEIDFVGDPRIAKPVGDAPLFFDPAEIYIDAAPTAQRTTTVKVYNAADEPVKVGVGMLTPPPLKGVTLGDLEGLELCNIEWVRPEPAELTIKPNEQETLRLITDMPADAKYGSYYGVLSLRATYPDGQNAGTKSTYVCVTNKSVAVKPDVRPMKLTLGLQGVSEYIAVARFWNIGNTHLLPRCTASVATPNGTVVARASMSGEPGLMLPLQIRDFSGVFNFTTFVAGMYRLEATLEYGPKDSLTAQVPIKISVEPGGRRVVEVVKAEEFESTVGVKW